MALGHESATPLPPLLLSLPWYASMPLHEGQFDQWVSDEAPAEPFGSMWEPLEPGDSTCGAQAPGTAAMDATSSTALPAQHCSALDRARALEALQRRRACIPRGHRSSEREPMAFEEVDEAPAPEACRGLSVDSADGLQSTRAMCVRGASAGGISAPRTPPRQRRPAASTRPTGPAPEASPLRARPWFEEYNRLPRDPNGRPRALGCNSPSSSSGCSLPLETLEAPARMPRCVSAQALPSFDTLASAFCEADAEEGPIRAPLVMVAKAGRSSSCPARTSCSSAMPKKPPRRTDFLMLPGMDLDLEVELLDQVVLAKPEALWCVLKRGGVANERPGAPVPFFETPQPQSPPFPKASRRRIFAVSRAQAAQPFRVLSNLMHR